MGFFNDLLKKLSNTITKSDQSDVETEVNVVEINGIEYSELMQLQIDGNTYVYLADLDNPSNFMVRKLIFEDDGQYLIGLDSKEEFDKALACFSKNAMKNIF